MKNNISKIGGLIFCLFTSSLLFAQNVGIGTTTPTNPLHILYNGGHGLLIEKTNDYPSLQLKEASGDFWTMTDNVNRLDLIFTPNGGTPAAHFTIAESGNVGIGKTTPLFDLDVSGTTQTLYLQPGFKSADYEFIRYGNPGNYFAGIMNNIQPGLFGDGDDFTIFTYANRDIVLRAHNGDVHIQPTGTGRVGIGTTNPTQKLQVMGNIAWGNEGSSLVLSGTGGGAVELRGPAWTPFIDFSNDATSDFDMRFILNGDDQLAVKGGNMAVEGILSAQRMKVTTTGYPDYVFYENYDLKSPIEVKQFIEENGHLPGVPSEKEIVEKGLDLNDQSIWQQEKIEELFLHVIKITEEMEEMKKENETLKKQVSALSKD